MGAVFAGARRTVVTLIVGSSIWPFIMPSPRVGEDGGIMVVDPAVDGAPVVGEVTSGALSPTLGHPIALAYVEPALAAPGTELAIDVRGTLIPASVTTLPFYRRTT